MARCHVTAYPVSRYRTRSVTALGGGDIAHLCAPVSIHPIFRPSFLPASHSLTPSLALAHSLPFPLSLSLSLSPIRVLSLSIRPPISSATSSLSPSGARARTHTRTHAHARTHAQAGAPAARPPPRESLTVTYKSVYYKNYDLSRESDRNL